MYEKRIAHLEEAHRVLDKRITGLEKTGVYDDETLQSMKKRKLFLKDEIAKLRQHYTNFIDIHP
jgi:hypothetical protein